ncbi:MAG: hypothetical protein KDB82_15635 [Planctomycetes bacterium]|nr:hypothetical protein [Planctomycetota bacterium]
MFNGVKQVEQFPVRKTPIVHYNLPSEVIDPVTGDASIDVNTFTGLLWNAFPELPAPGNDLWAMNMFNGCTDNPTCPTPAPVPDWHYTHDIYKSPGGGWPDPSVTTAAAPPPGPPTTSGPEAYEFIATWTLSLQNQWFLRDVNGAVLTAAVPGNAPVQYESVEFASMPISIHEVSAITVYPVSPLLSASPPVAAQQETTANTPPGTGSNNIVRVNPPMHNILEWQYDGVGAPAGLLAAAWHESPAENTHIETNIGTLQGVPVPDYFGGGGPIDAGGGVYMKRFSDNWQQTTAGTGSTISIDDGVTYSYYLAAIGNHLIGYGVGLVDSAFALPGVVNNQEDLMNISVIFDMTAFIASGKEFQFVVEDLLRMQDTVNGDWMNPGPQSTLPGSDR